LKEFKTTSKFFEKGPIKFQLIFENNGRIHLAPYGIIEIYNMMGKKIDEVEVDPWFSMPDSLRFREVTWNRKFLFGRYVAKTSINRGYDGIIDQKGSFILDDTVEINIGGACMLGTFYRFLEVGRKPL